MTITTSANVDTARATLEERARTVRRLHRRQKLRRGAVAALAIGLILGVGLLGIPVSRHMSTAYYLRLEGMSVQWEIDEENWDTAGATKVEATSRFRDERLNDKELAMLSNLHRVESLRLADSGFFTDAGVRTIVQLVHLKDLNLERLNHLRHPSYYNPDQTLSDACLPPLQKLPRLETLDLAGNKITDAGLATIATFPFLESLDLTATEVTDAGLVQLTRLPRLKSVSLGATLVSPAGVKNLQKSRPELMIDTNVEPSIKEGVEFWRKQSR